VLQPRNFPRPTKQQVDLKQQKDVDLLKAQTLRKEGPAAVANDVDLWCGPILPASSHVRPSFKITRRSFSTIIICESQKLQLTSLKLLASHSDMRYLSVVYRCIIGVVAAEEERHVTVTVIFQSLALFLSSLLLEKNWAQQLKGV
jgi:hypothetical protein